MSKQLKEEWEDKWLKADAFKVRSCADFFYSLHLDHIKAIREKIESMKQEVYSMSIQTEQVNYNKAIDDVLLTIAE